MALSNRDRVSKGLDLLRDGLKPYFQREFQALYKDGWMDYARQSLANDYALNNQPFANWDAAPLLKIMWDQWNIVFNRTLGQSERSLVSELRTVRNNWAHQQAFTLDDAYRALDSIQRLLTAVNAPEARELEKQKQEILRLRFEEQAKVESRKVAIAPIEGQPAAGYRPWREIVTPHTDVARGTYQQAEFAADLGQVYRGEGTDEYRDPRSFFQRTFLTEGLKTLLSGALKRLSGTGGDPVVELQTNFGGGKTHSMLALFHLFSGAIPGDLLGVEEILKEAGVTTLPKVQRAALVGQALSPAQPQRKADGTEVFTMWGELAWQLLGRDGYELVAESDRKGVSPGSDILRQLFSAAAPCLILIDEWVAYLRMLYGKYDLTGGSFDSNLTFAQALTETARAVPRTLVVASLPASDIEIGGEGGREALSRLRNTFGRMESAWRPASAEEGFEIVRRRLFEPITEPSLYTARDAVVKAFTEMYRTQSAEFPSACREADYERRMKAAYPIHPELFDRLYNDWSTLEKFQRTRGVLRLMAAVIHALWERDDRSLLILPANVPVDDSTVQTELTRYLDDTWVPVIEKDVDGQHSLPLRLDRENPNLGRYSAARRVARTLYLGSAPTLNTANKGLDDQRIKLGCAQPGESVATFGDALRRLTDQATHLYVDGKRYWFSTQPSVNRLAQDRATQQKDDDIYLEILARLRVEQKDQKNRGDFSAVHLAPANSSEVPDERETRLVMLAPEHWHSRNAKDSPARKEVGIILDQRGSSPRRYRNALVFLAPDSARYKDLEQAVRQYLAWKSIEDERETLNLDNFQSNQAKVKRGQADDTIKQRIPETYIWLLVPGLPSPNAPNTELEWEELGLQGSDPLAVRASKKLKNQELLITQLGATRLKMELDRIPLWRGERNGADVGVKQLVDDFAQYLYLPRLRDPHVLTESIQAGVASMMWESETFAYAEGWDSQWEKYRGLKTGQITSVILDGESLVVKSEVAQRQIEEEDATRRAAEARRERERAEKAGNPPPPAHIRKLEPDVPDERDVPPIDTLKKEGLHRFHGSITLDALRLSRDVGTISEAVIQHLAGLLRSKGKITLEIEADLPEGTPDNVVRTVTENCRTLKFEQFGFEEN
ncbi:MAG: ATP-binding protein [Chloroflexi bacterium]|uniref:ATP-binding protein n=1 Tax=Candidatus Chlorohelix allophototropha TaxID=3003348 RepID=A0A8T7M4L8_9CHLR|nr:ATP-binding protein [Chloroflexota bacterium]